MRWQQEREEAKAATILMKKIKHDADLERLVTLALKNEVTYGEFFDLVLLTCFIYTIDYHVVVFLYEVAKKFLLILKKSIPLVRWKKTKKRDQS